MSGILHASTLLLALEVETVYSCAPTGVPELATHSFKITCKCSESAKEKRTALYNFFMFIKAITSFSSRTPRHIHTHLKLGQYTELTQNQSSFVVAQPNKRGIMVKNKTKNTFIY